MPLLAPTPPATVPVSTSVVIQRMDSIVQLAGLMGVDPVSGLPAPGIQEFSTVGVMSTTPTFLPGTITEQAVMPNNVFYPGNMTIGGDLTVQGATNIVPTTMSLYATVVTTGDTTGASDTLAIQTALNTNLPVLLGPGTFYINASLTMVTGDTLMGSGMNSSIISMTQTAVDAITFTDQRFITIRNLQIQGPGSGSGRGIAGHFTTQALAGLDITNVFIANMGGEGLYLETPITSVFRNVRCQTNAVNGSSEFRINNGTSCTFEGCYANAGGGIGYFINGLHYSAFNGCAADTITANNNGAYFIQAGLGLSFNGCGNESSTTGFKITSSSKAITLNGCRTYRQTQWAFLITGTSTGIVINGCMEDSPQVGATASIQVDSGSQAVVINPVTTTAQVYAAGTAFVITQTGGTAH